MGALNVSEMTDEQLAERAAVLAAQRTAIRLEQNEVQAEIDLRRALSSLSGETRRIIAVRLGGATTPQGEVQA